MSPAAAGRSFVTGGSGLVGQFLLAALVQAGQRPRASFRSQPPATLPDGVSADAVEWVKGDVLDVLFLQEAVAEMNCVYHAAAVVSYAPRDAERLWAVNVTGTANVVDALLTGNPGARLVYVSSVAALGAPLAENARLVDETARWNPDDDHAAYAKSKYAAEVEVWRGIHEGLAAGIVNPSVIIGPGDPGRSSTQLFRYTAEKHWYYPPGQLNLVDVRDVVTALLALGQGAAENLGSRYVLSAEALSYRTFFDQMAAALGVRAPTRELPAGLAEVLWRLEKVRGALTGAAPLLTRETARLGRRAVTFDGRRAAQALGVRYHAVAESIAWCAAALRAGGLGA